MVDMFRYLIVCFFVNLGIMNLIHFKTKGVLIEAL